MKINIINLMLGKVNVINFDFFFEKEEIPIENDDINFNGSLKVKGKITKSKDNYLMEAELKTRVKLECVKCLEEYDYDIEDIIKIVYINKEEIIDDDVEQYFSYFKEHTIDITDDIRQFIILNIPYYGICKNDCAGLCAGCGANLNKEECKCKEKIMDKNNLGNLILSKLKEAKKIKEVQDGITKI
ncbi:MAG TPA: DUF177 domain-containing protein [bacterium]|nr:DUF177 domain-containing protein [bacterium]HOL47189.1 DUF177 domain-containing protein [bacterium]HPQ17681.1 DUF177 domain-containing protein [bacterium]